MVKKRDPWWRLQDLVHDETKVKPDPEFFIRIDQVIGELENLKKEKLIDHSFNWSKIQPIKNLLDEMEELNDKVYLSAYNMNLKRIYKSTTDEEIKNDESVKRLIAMK
jgi:hypothetical protein